MAQYRGAVIGLGWMGMLYDIAQRSGERFEVDDADRPTPSLDVHRKFYHHEHPGKERIPVTYADALWDRPEIDLVSGADRDVKRLEAFKQRYSVEAVYTDAAKMLREQRPDIVAIATNTKGRADLTCLAVECGAKGIFTEKPMCHSLEEADRMVRTCAEAGVALNCGAISTTHPAMERAKQLLTDGHIGRLLSIEANAPFAQHQNWSYFLDSPPAWVIGVVDRPRDEGGSDEFRGQGMAVADDGMVVHFRASSSGTGVRLNGASGEMAFFHEGWRLWKDAETPAGKARVETPWPAPRYLPPYGAVYSLDDVMRTIAGELDEPKNSGRRVAVALEVEIALKVSSAQGGQRVDLPLADRSLRLNYPWFR
jgi:hypothetical protein